MRILIFSMLVVFFTKVCSSQTFIEYKNGGYEFEIKGNFLIVNDYNKNVEVNYFNRIKIDLLEYKSLIYFFDERNKKLFFLSEKGQFDFLKIYIEKDISVSKGINFLELGSFFLDTDISILLELFQSIGVKLKQVDTIEEFDTKKFKLIESKEILITPF